ncbi:hypothetical protein HD806DRAFT_545510 [Xylariaceae sp. AK1471]|nr:hypothetical protein HD806DRAFT_545510 [Xylariaceae sp. AK1471]
MASSSAPLGNYQSPTTSTRPLIYQSQYSFNILLRHIPICRGDDEAPTDPCGFSPDCQFSEECWGLWADGDLTSLSCKGSCCDEGYEEASDLDIVLLNRAMDEIRLYDLIHYCVNRVLHPLQGLEFEILRGFIVWQNGAPTFPRDSGELKAHNSAITPGHLALMDQRNYGDYIQIDFVVLHNDHDDKARRKSMLKALTKLSRKASRHCNR